MKNIISMRVQWVFTIFLMAYLALPVLTQSQDAFAKHGKPHAKNKVDKKKNRKIASDLFANHKSNVEDVECKKLSKNCSVCADGTLRSPASVKTILSNVGEYQCATGKNANPTEQNTCHTLSGFCAICADGSYKFTKTGEKIYSDLYECATKPRVTEFTE